MIPVEPTSPTYPLPGRSPSQPDSPCLQPPDSPCVEPESPVLEQDHRSTSSNTTCRAEPTEVELSQVDAPMRFAAATQESPSFALHASSLSQPDSPYMQPPDSPYSPCSPRRQLEIPPDLAKEHSQQSNRSAEPPVVELTPVDAPARFVAAAQEMLPLYNLSNSSEATTCITTLPSAAALQERVRRHSAALSIDCRREVLQAPILRVPLVRKPSKPPGPNSFQDLLAQLSAAHELECEALREQLRRAESATARAQTSNADVPAKAYSTIAGTEGMSNLSGVDKFQTEQPRRKKPHRRSCTADCLHDVDLPVPRRSVFKATVEAEKAKHAAKQASKSVEAWQPSVPEEEPAVLPTPMTDVEASPQQKKRTRTSSLHRYDSGNTCLTTQTLAGSVGYRNGLTGSLQSEVSSMCSDEGLWQPRSVWTKDSSRMMPGSIPPSSYTRAFSHYLRSLSGVEEDDKGMVTRYNGFLRHFISFPTSPSRLVWDVISAVLIFYDLIMVPLKVFDPPESAFTDAMVWFTLIFWTCNMFASVTVGYMHKGTTVMDPYKILLQYFKRWFWVDLLIVVPDWVVTCTSGQAGSVRLVKILRLVRTFRIIRIVRLRWIWAVVDDLLDSEVASIFVNIFKMIITLLAVNHVTACLWYFIADVQDESALTWVRAQGYEGKSWIYCYLTAFHWSITQFTPASMDVQPQNVPERLYTNVLIVIYLVGFSYLVGSITGSLTQLRSLTEEGAKQFWILRKYLRQNQVPLALSLRVQKTLEHAWQKKMERMQIQEITILRLLSDQLRDELNAAISVPHMSVHPLFEHLYQTSEVTMHRLANKAIHRKHFAQNDGLFFPGEKATHMYFIVSGTMAYTQVTKHGIQKKPHEIVGDKEDSNKRQQQEWISEQVLWIDGWTHLGALMATKESALLLVDAKAFAEILELTPPVFHIAKTYAAQYLEWVHEFQFEDLTDICSADDWVSKVHSWIQAEVETQKPTLSRTRRFMDTGEFPMLPRLSGKASRVSWTSIAP